MAGARRRGGGGGRRTRPRRGPMRAAHRLRENQTAEAGGAVRSLRAFFRSRVVPRYRARARADDVSERAGVVDRRLCDLPCAACARRRTPLATVARAAAAART